MSISCFDFRVLRIAWFVAIHGKASLQKKKERTDENEIIIGTKTLAKKEAKYICHSIAFAEMTDNNIFRYKFSSASLAKPAVSIRLICILCALLCASNAKRIRMNRLFLIYFI